MNPAQHPAHQPAPDTLQRPLAPPATPVPTAQPGPWRRPGLREQVREQAQRADERHRDRAAARAAAAAARPARRGKTDRHGGRGRGAGRLAHRMRLPAHTASSGVLKSWYPWLMDPGLGVPGPYIGVDLFSRASFLFSPWALYEAGLLTSPNGLIIGEIGSGKSALMKSLMIRFRAVGVPFSWVDVKGEYDDLARAVGVTPLRLGPGLGVSLNPLAPIRRHPQHSVAAWRAAVKSRRLALLEALAHIRLGRGLSMTERTALELALAACTGEMPGAARDELAPASLPGVVTELATVDQWADELARLGITGAQLLDESRDARLALSGLVTGALAGMFDSSEPDTHRHLDFRAPGTIVNLSAIRADQSLSVMSMVCAQSAMEAELMHPDSPPRLIGYDEAWLAMRYPPVLRRLQEQFKLSRLFGAFNMLAAHRLSDFDAVGDQGSEAARLARGLLEDTGVRICYRQVEASLPVTRELFGLTDVQTELLRYLRKGSGMWLLGGRAFVVAHMLSSIEHPLVQTDSRMLATPGVDDVSDEDWEALFDESLLATGDPANPADTPHRPADGAAPARRSRRSRSRRQP